MIKKEELTILRESLLLKHMRIRGVQMGEGVGVRDGTTRTSSASARGHPTHHRAGLAHLRSTRLGDPRMHLLYHSLSRMSVWMLSGHWVVARGHAMLHALMGGKRLRHHHCGGSQGATGNLSKGVNRESDEERRPRGEAMCDGSSAPETVRRSVLAFSGWRPRPGELIQRDTAGASIGTSAYSHSPGSPSMQASFS